MQKIYSLELHAKRFPRTQGVELRDHPKIKELLEEGWVVRHLCTNFINQNVYVIIFVLEKTVS